MRLLRAAGVGASLAEEIAGRWKFRQTVAFVAGYLADPRANGPGVLKSRCLGPDAAAPFLASTAPELQHMLIRQHVTDDDFLAWARDDKASVQAAESARYRIDAALRPATTGLPDLPPAPTPDEQVAAALETLRNRVPEAKRAKLVGLVPDLQGDTLYIRGTGEQLEVLQGTGLTLRNLLSRCSGVFVRGIEYLEVGATG